MQTPAALTKQLTLCCSSPSLPVLGRVHASAEHVPAADGVLTVDACAGHEDAGAGHPAPQPCARHLHLRAGHPAALGHLGRGACGAGRHERALLPPQAQLCRQPGLLQARPSWRGPHSEHLLSLHAGHAQPVPGPRPSLSGLSQVLPTGTGPALMGWLLPECSVTPGRPLSQYLSPRCSCGSNSSGEGSCRWDVEPAICPDEEGVCQPSSRYNRPEGYSQLPPSTSAEQVGTGPRGLH